MNQYYECQLPFNNTNYESLNKALKNVLKANFNIIEPYKPGNKKEGIIRNVASRKNLHEVSYRWGVGKLIVNCGTRPENTKAVNIVSSALKELDASYKLRSIALPNGQMF